MKKYILILTMAWASIGVFSKAYAHDEPSRIGIEYESPDHVTAGNIQIDFDMIDFQLKTVVVDTTLAIDNEKILHCFIYDPYLKEFRHEHPTFDGKMWHVTTNLSVNGNYWVWMQGTLAADSFAFTTSARLMVTGGTPANPDVPVLGNVLSGTDGTSMITLDPGTLTAGGMAMLNVTFSRTDGTTPVITPYLGAMAHITIVTSDADSLVHAHPMDGDATHMMIHTEFKDAGDYRLWVQFMDGGVLKTIPLSVTVN